jgi:hypothetical protein
MGEATRRKKLKPKKIRVLSEAELLGTAMAYIKLYKTDAYLANLMLISTELSPIPLNSPEDIEAYVKQNRDFLQTQFIKRFRSIDEDSLESIEIKMSHRLRELWGKIKKNKRVDGENTLRNES